MPCRWTEQELKTKQNKTQAELDICDIVIYNKKCTFGLLPSSWLGAPKTLGTSCDKNNKGIICYVNKATFGKSLGKHTTIRPVLGFPGGASVKGPAHQCRRHEMQVQFLSWEDPLEEGVATHLSILAWRSHGRRRLAGDCPWGCKKLDSTEATQHA